MNNNAAALAALVVLGFLGGPALAASPVVQPAAGAPPTMSQAECNALFDAELGRRSANMRRQEVDLSGEECPPAGWAATQQASPKIGPITIDARINFDRDRSALEPADRGQLDRIASELAAAPNTPVKVIGYADGIGSNAYDTKLSERRAEAVAAYLEQAGVPASSLTLEAMGKSHPVASNDTAEGRAGNCRVELHGTTVTTQQPALTPRLGGYVDATTGTAEGEIARLDFDHRIVTLDGDRQFVVPNAGMMNGLVIGDYLTVFYQVKDGQAVPTALEKKQLGANNR